MKLMTRHEHISKSKTTAQNNTIVYQVKSYNFFEYGSIHDRDRVPFFIFTPAVILSPAAGVRRPPMPSLGHLLPVYIFNVLLGCVKPIRVQYEPFPVIRSPNQAHW
jgi:hypothetical protein